MVCGSALSVAQFLKGIAPQEIAKMPAGLPFILLRPAKGEKIETLLEGNEGEMITFDDIDLTINTTGNELYVL